MLIRIPYIMASPSVQLGQENAAGVVVLILELPLSHFKAEKRGLQRSNLENRRLRRKIGKIKKVRIFQKSVVFANLGEITTDRTRNNFSIACGLK